MKPLPDHLPPVFFLRDGKTCNLHEPEATAFANLDVGLTLATINRWGGHTRNRYSVAQHSLFVAALVPNHLKKAALVHDAGEAITGDICRPLRAAFPALDNLCDEWQHAADAFYKVDHVTALDGMRLELADDLATAIEARDLLGQTPDKITLAQLPDIYGFPHMQNLFGLCESTTEWKVIWDRCLWNDDDKFKLQPYLDFIETKTRVGLAHTLSIISCFEAMRTHLDQVFDNYKGT